MHTITFKHASVAVHVCSTDKSFSPSKHTYIHTHIHTCTHTYIHTYIHTVHSCHVQVGAVCGFVLFYVFVHQVVR